jgi:hypothetical protein
MQLEVRIGAHYGEVREFPRPVGEKLLADGRAVYPGATQEESREGQVSKRRSKK